jgi:hypothetical protein
MRNSGERTACPPVCGRPACCFRPPAENLPRCKLGRRRNNRQRIYKTSAAVRPAAGRVHASGPHTGGQAVRSPIAILREHDVRGRRRVDGKPERVSDRKIPNQSVGRIFTAGETPALTAVSAQRESAGRIFTSSALTHYLVFPRETTTITGSFPESGT